MTTDDGAARRPPGMHDVARRAGVSHQTVSRVLNGHANVRTETRDRVLAVIAELGYRRNSAARALVTRKSATIGVLSSGSNLWGPSSALIAVERAARDAGYFVSLASVSSAEDEQVTAAMDHFSQQSVEGIIVIAPEGALAQVANPYAAQVPVVMVADGAPPSPGVHITSVDQQAGARLATRHLLDLGHRSIAHVAGPAGWFDAIARRRGWRDELLRAKQRPGPVLVGDWSADSGYQAGRDVLTGARTTAVFVANDQMALGVIRAIHDAGLTVPQDISVVGFDDIPGAAYFVPALTTVRQDFLALGQQCIDILLAAMDDAGGSAAPSSPIVPTLAVRSSTAPPRE